jgi:hypothetical protein
MEWGGTTWLSTQGNLGLWLLLETWQVIVNARLEIVSNLEVFIVH